MSTTYITPAGFKVLVAEYEHLMKVERPKMTREVAYAASLGDRSENAEYKYGKQRLREIDRRLHYLQKRLGNVEVVEPDSVAGDIVRFGAYVSFEDEDGGPEQTIQIVGMDEIDTPQGKVSYRSPIGQAFIGKEEGDLVTIKTPQGPRKVVILELWFEGQERE
ncbi:MAG: transcription elongation factor GreB [Myxococcota bacterium]|nr:transcription elongation factor GreB [Myxococcota bacterium]